GRIAALLADWAVLVALLALVYRESGSVATLGLFVLARVLPRALLTLVPFAAVDRLTARGLALLSLARVPLVAVLALVSEEGDLWWAALVVFAAAVLSTMADSGHRSWLGRATPRIALSDANARDVAVERMC